jgi:hypothetical protein
MKKWRERGERVRLSERKVKQESQVEQQREKHLRKATP